MHQVARRHVLTSLAGLPLAAILADPHLVRAAAAGVDTVSIATQGGREVSAAIAVPDVTPAPTVLLIHQWWGLVDQIKAVAVEFAKEGYVGLAVDLYGGRTADDPDGARALMNAVKSDEANDTLRSWLAWLRDHERGSGKLATIGWCFGGGWSLDASIATPVDATVIYYGRVTRSAEELATLKGPVQGHFATRDGWITKEMVDGFEAQMAKAGKPLTSYWYEADHAFGDPTSPRYDLANAQLAWERTLAFMGANLGA